MLAQLFGLGADDLFQLEFFFSEFFNGRQAIAKTFDKPLSAFFVQEPPFFQSEIIRVPSEFRENDSIHGLRPKDLHHIKGQ